jgi:LysM repeat protein
VAHALQRLGPMAVSPVSSGSPEVPASPPEATWVVQPGDTLSGIARQLQRTGTPGTSAELVQTLARLNGLSDPDRISVGQVLTLPPRTERPRDEDVVALVERDVLHGLQQLRVSAGEQRTRLENALLGFLHRVPADAGPRPTSSGTPCFRQSDPAWRSERLGVAGEGPTLAQAGCAITACAMALSRLGGTVLTPDALVRHLRDSGGFQGPLLDWSAAGTAIHEGPRATPGTLDCARLDRELDAGRPVLLRVVHDVQGRPRQHWVCLTGRDPATGDYTANDPATGRSTVLARAGAGLESLGGEPVQYASDGRMVTFVRAAT